MKFQKEMLLLYAVTDRVWTGEKTLYAQVEEVLEGGATMVQLREKKISTEELIREAAGMRELCHRYGGAPHCQRQCRGGDKKRGRRCSRGPGGYAGGGYPCHGRRGLYHRSHRQDRGTGAGGGGSRGGLSRRGSGVSVADQEERDPHYHRRSVQDLRCPSPFPWWLSAGSDWKISANSPEAGWTVWQWYPLFSERRISVRLPGN